MARFDFERVIFSVTIGVEPFADRIARVGFFRLMGPIASISMDFARRRESRFIQHVDRLSGDNDLDRETRRHLPRHAGRNAAVGRIITLSTQRLVGEARLEYRLIFRRQWWLLAATRRLAGIVARRPCVAAPFSLPGWIFGRIDHLRTGGFERDTQRRHQSDGAECITANHSESSQNVGFLIRRMGRGKARSFFTRMSETHHCAAKGVGGFRKRTREERALLLYPSYNTLHFCAKYRRSGGCWPFFA